MEDIIGKRITVFHNLEITQEISLRIPDLFCICKGRYTAILDFLKLDFQAFDTIYCLFDM